MTNYAVEDVALAYAPVPPEMLTHRPKVTEAEIKTWCAFAMNRTLSNSESHLGAQTVAGMLGVDRTTVGRAVEGLKKKGFLIDLGRTRDPDTKRWGPRRFAVAVGGQRLVYGRIAQPKASDAGEAPETPDASEEGAEEETKATMQTHDAPAPPGSTNRASAHKKVEEATMQATMQTHDALHDASVHHPILVEGSRREKKVVEDLSEGASPSSPKTNDAQTHNSPNGHTPRSVSDGDKPANYMTSLTVERSGEVGFDAAPHQKQNWGRGWSEYLYVAGGDQPPPVEEQHAVLGEIVAAAAGRLGAGRFFLSVPDAVKRVRGGGRNGSGAGRRPTTNGRAGAGGASSDERLQGESKEEARKRRAEDRRRQMEEVFGRG